MAARIIARVLIIAAWLVGIIITIGGIDLIYSMSFGVDPLECGVTTNGVDVCFATQRMGDSRVYLYVDNRSRDSISADITLGAPNNQAHKDRTETLHVTLGPGESKRIYHDHLKEQWGPIVSLKVTKSLAK